jgi:hypothetical protein
VAGTRVGKEGVARARLDVHLHWPTGLLQCRLYSERLTCDARVLLTVEDEEGGLRPGKPCCIHRAVIRRGSADFRRCNGQDERVRSAEAVACHAESIRAHTLQRLQVGDAAAQVGDNIDYGEPRERCR